MRLKYVPLMSFFILQAASSCFITNCPVGSGKKRSDSSFGLLPLRTQYEQCPTCGPHNMGHCYGPQLCCSSSFGCFVYAERLKERNPCQSEVNYPVPCKNKGKSCSSVLEDGQCVFDNYCCNPSGTCSFVDKSICSDEKGGRREKTKEELLQDLRRNLESYHHRHNLFKGSPQELQTFDLDDGEEDLKQI